MLADVPPKRKKILPEIVERSEKADYLNPLHQHMDRVIALLGAPMALLIQNMAGRGPFIRPLQLRGFNPANPIDVDAEYFDDDDEDDEDGFHHHLHHHPHYHPGWWDDDDDSDEEEEDDDDEEGDDLCPGCGGYHVAPHEAWFEDEEEEDDEDDYDQ